MVLETQTELALCPWYGQMPGKLVSALTKGTGYRLIHSAGPAVAGCIATLIDAQTEPGTGQVCGAGDYTAARRFMPQWIARALRAAGGRPADGDQWISAAT